MGQIDCVVFDIGNVLVRWDVRNLYRRMGYADAETASILAETNLLQIKSPRRFATTLEPLVARFPPYQEFIRALDTRWVELLGAIPSTVTIFRRLKQVGVSVHAISNFNREKFDIASALFPLPQRL